MKKRIYITVLILLMQIIVALVVHDSVVYVFSDRPRINDVNSRITIASVPYVYVPLCIIISIVIQFVKNRLGLYSLLALIFLTFILLYIQGYSYRPNRTLLLYVSAFVGIFSPFFLFEILILFLGEKFPNIKPWWTR